MKKPFSALKNGEKGDLKFSFSNLKFINSVVNDILFTCQMHIFNFLVEVGVICSNPIKIM